MSLLSTVAAITISAVGSSNYHYQDMIPERLLATAPISPDLNGVLWHSRYPVGTRAPIAERRYGDAGPARYGAPAEAADDLVYVRIDHVVVAISPWERFTAQGHQKLERARNLWLRERGLVGGVRTHVNAAHIPLEVEHAAAPVRDEIKPRAVLHIRERIPANNGPTRAMAKPPMFTVVSNTTELAQSDAV